MVSIGPVVADHHGAVLFAPMRGDKLGPYSLLEPLGAGGMGEVWLAEDTRLGRKVAIKILPEEFANDAERRSRFEREARAAAALNHPHIAAVYDIGSEGAKHFMVQEYLQGADLRARINAGRLPLLEALTAWQDLPGCRAAPD